MQTIKNCLTKYSKRSILMLLYMFMMGVCSYFLTNITRSIVYFFIMPLQMAMVCTLVKEKALRKTGLFKIVAIFLLWLFFVYLINDMWNADGMIVLLGMLVAWTVPLFVSEDTTYCDIHRELFGVGMIFIICYIPIILLALLSVFTGYPIKVPFDAKPIGIQTAGFIGDRIRLLSHPNISGRVPVFNVLFCIYGISTRRKKGLRIFFALMILLNLMALAHTQSRTCYIIMGLAAGALAFRAVYLAVGKKWIRFIAAALALVIVLLGVMYGLDALLKLDVSIAKHTCLVDQEKSGVRTDYLELFDTSMSGRDAIWKAIMQYLRDNPKSLVIGMGTFSITGTISENEVYGFLSDVPHVHSAYLNVLAHGGIPALLLLFVFLLMLVKPAWMVLLAPGTDENRGLYVLPAFMLAILAMGLTETGLFLDAGYMNYLFMAVAGLTLRCSKMLGSGK